MPRPAGILTAAFEGMTISDSVVQGNLVVAMSRTESSTVGHSRPNHGSPRISFEAGTLAV